MKFIQLHLFSFFLKKIFFIQTDTSIAIETKSMRKWEFYSINEALHCTPSWFSGTPSETQRLQSNLVLLRNKIPSHSPRGITVASKEQLFEDTSPAQRLPEEIFFDARECSFDMQDNRTMEVEELINGKKEQNTEDEINIASLGFKDTLLLLWFNDRDLPIILRQVITSNSRLLALLELGLPTWVIFLQSYPLFSKVYHPWMQPLVRILYVLISLITMIIGFYDLYKNVPLLKATASHLFGPIFKWIEKSEMITRIFYLGTMLFVQNFGKALEWVLMMMRVIKTPVSILMTPFMDPLEGMVEVISSIWNILAETGEQFFYTAQLMAESLCSMVVDLTQVLISPFELLYSLVSTLGIINIIWNLFVQVIFLFISFLLCFIQVASYGKPHQSIDDLLPFFLMKKKKKKSRVLWSLKMCFSKQFLYWICNWQNLFDQCCFPLSLFC